MSRKDIELLLRKYLKRTGRQRTLDALILDNCQEPVGNGKKSAPKLSFTIQKAPERKIDIEFTEKPKKKRKIESKESEGKDNSFDNYK
jgi:hypothetical protein